jgi:hypothetical protein
MRETRPSQWRSTLRFVSAASGLVEPQSEKDAKLAQKLGQLQPVVAVFP